MIQTLASLSLGGAGRASSRWTRPSWSATLVDPIRVLIGVVLIVLAVRAARRGRPGRALLLGCIGVMLIALARGLVLGDATAAPIDADVLNLVATGVVLVALVVTAGPPPADRPAGPGLRRHPDPVGAVLRPRLHLRPAGLRCSASPVRRWCCSV